MKDFMTKQKKKASRETAEKFAKKVAQAICDNTYPSFDKDGKPVNIWNAVTGYDRIDEIAKEITGEKGGYIDCHRCKHRYDCERTYLGGCTDGEEWSELYEKNKSISSL